mmetsp:Transcript_90227/g.160707  ORF Transcript_90227/g.160707 Transcript_90227/m.160707 type:complete len:320 (+) Transcript_90227:38-997(+)
MKETHLHVALITALSLCIQAGAVIRREVLAKNEAAAVVAEILDAHTEQSCACRQVSYLHHHPPGAAVATAVPCFSEQQTNFRPEGSVCFGFETDYLRCLTRTASPTLYLLGDSHSDQIRESLREAAKASGMTLQSLSDDGSCTDNRDMDRLFNHLGSILKQGDIVVLMFRQTQYIVEKEGVGACGQTPTALEFKNLYERFYKVTSGASAKLALFHDFPKLKWPIQQCAIAGNLDKCSITSADSLAEQAATRKVINDLVSSNHPGAYEFDVHPLLCGNDGVCTGMVPGSHTYAYADDDHISHVGASYLRPFFCAFLAGLQ